MTKNLPPLFYIQSKDETFEVGAKVVIDDEIYKNVTLVEEVIDALKEDLSKIAEAKELGPTFISAWILLESLHKMGMGKVAENLIHNPALLYQSALFTLIGIKAGQTLPEGMKIETTTCPSDISLRDSAVLSS